MANRILKIKTDFSSEERNSNIKQGFHSQIANDYEHGHRDQKANKRSTSVSIDRQSRSGNSRLRSQQQQPLMSPVSKYLGSNSSHLKDQNQQCYISVGVGPQKEVVLDWSKTPLFDYYLRNQESLDFTNWGTVGTKLQTWDQHHYTQTEIESLVNKFRESFTDLAHHTIYSPIYMRALLTLKLLFNEQSIPQTKFQKLRELYGDVTVKNTVKLLIRCQILFSSRCDLLHLFNHFTSFQIKSQNIKQTLEAMQPLDKSQGRQYLSRVHQDLKDLANDLDSLAEAIGQKHHEIRSNRKYKQLKGVDLYFKGQSLLVLVNSTIQHLNSQFKQRCPGDLSILIKPLLSGNQENASLESKRGQIIKVVSSSSKNEDRKVSQMTFRKRSNTVRENIVSKENQMEAVVAESADDPQQIIEEELEPTESQKDAFDEHFQQQLTKPPPLKINNLSADQVRRLFHLGMLTDNQAQEALQKINLNELKLRQTIQEGFKARKKKRPNKSVQSKRPVYNDGILPTQRKKVNTNTLTYTQQWTNTKQPSHIFQRRQSIQNKPKYTAFGIQSSSPPQRKITTAEGGQNIRQDNKFVTGVLSQKDSPRLKTSHIGKRIPKIFDKELLDATQSNTHSGPFSQYKNNFMTDASSNVRRPATQGGGTFLDRLQSRGSSRLAGSDRHQLATMSPKQTQGYLEFEQVDEESARGARKQTDQESSHSGGKDGAQALMDQDVQIDNFQYANVLSSPPNPQPVDNLAAQLKPILREPVFVKSEAKAGTKRVQVPHLFAVKEQAVVKKATKTSQPRAQTVQRRLDPHTLALKDGRRNGFFNLNLNPIVERERSSKIKDDKELSKGITLEACLLEINRRQGYFPGYLSKCQRREDPKDLLKVGGQEDLNDKKTGAKVKKGSKDSVSNEYPSFLEQSIQEVVPPIATKILNLQTKLKNYGVSLPGTQRGPVSRSKIGFLDQQVRGKNAPFASTYTHNSARNYEGSDAGVTDSIMKSVRSNQPSNGQFIPYGGHTKASLIKQEISNYQNSARGYDNSLTSRDIQDLKDMKEASMQGRQTLHARLTDFGASNTRNQPETSVPLKTQSPFMIAPMRPPARAQNRGQSKETKDKLEENSKFLIGDSILSEVPVNLPSSLSPSPLYTMREVVQQIGPQFGNSQDTFQGPIIIQKEKPSFLSSLSQPTQQAQAVPIKTSAIGSLYEGNGRTVNFTAKFSNVWGETEYMMFKDTRLQTPAEPMDVLPQPSPNALLLNLQRQVQKLERVKEKEVKEKMRAFYMEHYGIEASNQDFFFMNAGQLRDKLIKKSKISQINAAAQRIQRWFRSHRARANLLKSLRRYAKAIVTIQRFCVYWKTEIKNPHTLRGKQRIGSKLIQKFLRGYQVRRKYMYELMNMRADLMHEPWRIIDIIARGHFQRQVRRVWLAYKARKAEKKRKRLARLKKNKGKKKKKKKKAAAATMPPGTSVDMMDGVTNINLAQTGGEDAPEEEAEEDEGEDLERADGEEGEDGEDGDKGPKLTIEQSEKLQKDFEEMNPDQEGLVTRLDLQSLLQGLGEDFTEELIEEYLKSAEEDEETQMITFDDFLKAVTVQVLDEGDNPDENENQDSNKILEQANESDKDSQQIAETQLLEQSPHPSGQNANFPAPQIMSGPLRNSMQKMEEKGLDDDQIVAQKRTLSQPSIMQDDNRKTLKDDLTLSHTETSDQRMQPIVDEVLLNLEVNMDPKATQRAIEDRSNSPRLSRCPSQDKKQSKTSLKLKIITNAIQEEALEESYREHKINQEPPTPETQSNQKGANNGLQPSLLKSISQSPTNHQNSCDGILDLQDIEQKSQGRRFEPQKDFIAKQKQTKMESSPTLDKYDDFLIAKEAQKLSSGHDAATMEVDKLSLKIVDNPSGKEQFSSGSSKLQLAEDFIDGLFSNVDKKMAPKEQPALFAELNQDSDSDQNKHQDFKGEEKAIDNKNESLGVAFGIHRLKRISRHQSKELAEEIRQGTQSEQVSKRLPLTQSDHNNQDQKKL